MSGNEHGEIAASLRTQQDAAMVKISIETALPFLRRYARALTGSQDEGDNIVRVVLEATLSNPELLARVSRGRVELYTVFSEIWNSAGVVNSSNSDNCGEAFERQVQLRLAKVLPIPRQALLLTQLEEFSLVEAGEILKISADETGLLVNQAVADIEQDAATSVLVIEDEPLVASHIEAIVQDMGHRVVGIAATAREANDAFAAHQPGLVLADIQLADGSSGLTAVANILALGTVPIVFITAFPEKLLTGARPEPSFLVAKPFREETLRATISQALFFGSNFTARVVC